jgi:S-methylmethionine-dependent homocysteine/selenocysteine methylase
MSKYRNALPQISEDIFITDGGLETTLIFHNHQDLPAFAAFDLLKRDDGYQTLRDYFLTYIDIARENQVGFVMESPTWRASRDWGSKLGYRPGELRDLNLKSIGMLTDLRSEWETETTPMVISGNIGPRGDGYRVDRKMTAVQAMAYHQEQIETFSRSPADLVSAFTINYVEEAIGITWAAQSAKIPVVISFTVETDGRLPSGQPLGAAVETVDAATNNGPAYYMINCAHPTHFKGALTEGRPWVERIRAVRANASAKSHAELDEAVALDAGDPAELGAYHVDLKRLLPRLNIFGGCCGTDPRHVAAICQSVTAH